MTDKGGVNAATSVHVRFLCDEQTLKNARSHLEKPLAANGRSRSSDITRTITR